MKSFSAAETSSLCDQHVRCVKATRAAAQLAAASYIYNKYRAEEEEEEEAEEANQLKTNKSSVNN